MAELVDLCSQSPTKEKLEESHDNSCLLYDLPTQPMTPESKRSTSPQCSCPISPDLFDDGPENACLVHFGQSPVNNLQSQYQLRTPPANWVESPIDSITDSPSPTCTQDRKDRKLNRQLRFQSPVFGSPMFGSSIPAGMESYGESLSNWNWNYIPSDSEESDEELTTQDWNMFRWNVY